MYCQRCGCLLWYADEEDDGVCGACLWAATDDDDGTNDDDEEPACT